jgi:hypothetical protein
MTLAAEQNFDAGFHAIDSEAHLEVIFAAPGSLDMQLCRAMTALARNVGNKRRHVELVLAMSRCGRRMAADALPESRADESLAEPQSIQLRQTMVDRLLSGCDVEPISVGEVGDSMLNARWISSRSGTVLDRDKRDAVFAGSQGIVKDHGFDLAANGSLSGQFSFLNVVGPAHVSPFGILDCVAGKPRNRRTL